MLYDKCLKRKPNLPLVACDEMICDWYIRDGGYNNCFWVLSNALAEYPREMDINEIAHLEGISAEEVQSVLTTALKKVRKDIRKIYKKI